jgi:hypothetical protein
VPVPRPRGAASAGIPAALATFPALPCNAASFSLLFARKEEVGPGARPQPGPRAGPSCPEMWCIGPPAHSVAGDRGRGPSPDQMCVTGVQIRSRL